MNRRSIFTFFPSSKIQSPKKIILHFENRKMVHILFSPSGRAVQKPSFAMKNLRATPIFSTFTPGGHVSKMYKKRVAKELKAIGGGYTKRHHVRRHKKAKTLKPCKAGYTRRTEKPRVCRSACKRYASKVKGRSGKCKYRRTTGGKRVPVMALTSRRHHKK